MPIKPDAFGPAVTPDRLNRAFNAAADRASAFADATAKSVSSVSGLVEGFRGLSKTVSGVGAGMSALGFAIAGPVGLLAGVPGLAAGALGQLGGAVAGAGIGLASAASPNGLESVDKAFGILAGTIGSLVLPGFVLLGGAAMAGAEVIGAWIKAHRKDVIDFWANAVNDATNAVKSFTRWVSEWRPGGEKSQSVKEFLGIAPQNQFGARGRDPRFPQMEAPSADERRRLTKEALAELNAGGVGAMIPGGLGGLGARLGNLPVGGGVGGMAAANAKVNAAVQQPEAAGDRFLRRMGQFSEMIVKDMQQSMARTGITDPVSRWKEIAMGVQKSDLEIRKMSMFQDALNLVRDVVAEFRQRNARAPAAVAGP